MADEFQTGIYGGSWWNTVRSDGFDRKAMSGATALASCLSASREALINWSAAGISCDESTDSASGSSVSFQDTHKAQRSTDSTSQIPSCILSPSTMDWTQVLHVGETNFHAMLQDDQSSRPLFLQDLSMDSNQVLTGTDDCTTNYFKDMNHKSLQYQHHPSFSNGPSDCGINISPLVQETIYDNWSVNYQPQIVGSHGVPSELPQTSSPEVPQLLMALPPRQQSRSKALPPRQQSSMKKGGSSEPAFKKPRLDLETSSTLPIFKVRKEKLGDRITLLQQMVSPFGKADTASVLHETIEYIKFLHDQVSVSSTTYLRNGNPMQRHQTLDKEEDGDRPKQDLRSRGLCLVPVASTYQLASHTPEDSLTSTFGGFYRSWGDTSFHAMLEGDINSRSFLEQEPFINSDQVLQASQTIP